MRFHTCTAVLLLVATVVLVVCAPGCHAYNVKYSIVTTGPTLSDPDSAGCSAQDSALHMAMPPTALGQSLALQTAGTASADYLPLGGEARTAQCSDEDCPWVWNDGLYYMNPYLFFLGVVVVNSDTNQRLPMSLHVGGDNGTGNVYCNFDSCTNMASGSYPAYDPGQGYWGNRKVAMVRTTGAWQNVAYNISFSQWLCETYEFQVDSVVNDSARFGLAMWPASHEGDVLVYPSLDVSTYQYCPNDPKKRIKIKSNRYLYPNCHAGFPWWGGLIIAIVCFIIVVALILIIWCCCLRSRDQKMQDQQDQKNRTQRDNTTNVPTQSQMGMSRASTLTGDTYEDEYSDKDSYSRE